MWTVWKQTDRNDRCAAFHQMIYATLGNHAQPIPQNSPLCSFTLWSRSLTWEASEHIRQAELNIDMSKWIMNVLQSKKWKCNSYQIKMNFLFFLFFTGRESDIPWEWKSDIWKRRWEKWNPCSSEGHHFPIYITTYSSRTAHSWCCKT